MQEETILVSRTFRDGLEKESLPAFPPSLPSIDFPPEGFWENVVRPAMPTPVKGILCRILDVEPEPSWEDLGLHTVDERWQYCEDLMNERLDAVKTKLKEKPKEIREEAAKQTGEAKEALEGMASALEQQIDGIKADFSSFSSFKDTFKSLALSMLPKFSWPIYPKELLLTVLQQMINPMIEPFVTLSDEIKKLAEMKIDSDSCQEYWDQMKTTMTVMATELVEQLTAPVAEFVTMIKNAVEAFEQKYGELKIDKDKEAGEKLKEFVTGFFSLDELKKKIIEAMSPLISGFSAFIKFGDNLVNTKCMLLPYVSIPLMPQEVPISIVTIAGMKFIRITQSKEDNKKNADKIVEIKFKVIDYVLRFCTKIFYMYEGVTTSVPPVPIVRPCVAKINRFGMKLPTKTEDLEDPVMKDDAEAPGSRFRKTLEKLLKSAEIIPELYPAEQFMTDGNFSEALQVMLDPIKEVGPDSDKNIYELNLDQLCEQISLALQTTGILGAPPVGMTTLDPPSEGTATMISSFIVNPPIPSL